MDPAIRLLQDLVAIDSVNPSLVPGAAGERQIARFIADEMRAAGLDVEMEDAAADRPNVVGILEGRTPGRTLMFCGHTDTVGVAGMARPFSPETRDGRLFGRGAQDMKGGLAAMLAAVRFVAGHGGPASGRILVAAVADEEHGSAGAEALVKHWTADAAVVTEPTDLAIGIGHKGFDWIELETLGRAAHGSRPQEGEDAILRLGRVLSALETLDRALQARAPHPLVGAASLHASVVSGGREWSSYPDRAVLQMERRTLPGEPASAALDEARAIVAQLRAADPSFRGSARHVFGRPAYEIAPAHDLPQRLGAAIGRAGGAVRVAGASFWTDAAILAAAGIPAVLFGPGGAGLHSIEEWVTVADVLLCRDALVELARTYG
ncbi:MAG: M20/M25/M40 family metallo-hydrolase [Acidobacteria bacterium]|nr:M20/M25/M40 family metallo-hydrolase [Acidobacteriota bacterium]